MDDLYARFMKGRAPASRIYIAQELHLLSIKIAPDRLDGAHSCFVFNAGKGSGRGSNHVLGH